MPIRIQRILADPSSLPSQIPGRRATSDDFGGQVAEVGYRAGQDLQQQGLGAMVQLRQIEQALQQEDEKLDLTTKMAQLKVDFAQREAEIRESGKVEPKDYAVTVKQELQRLTQEAEGQLKYPGSLTRFRAAAAPYLAEQAVAGVHAGVKLQHAAIEVADGLQAREEINQAVFGPTPEARAAAIDARSRRVINFVRIGMWSGAKGDAEMLKMAEEIDEGRARRDFANPETRSATINALMSGQMKYMHPVKQQTLARTLQDQADTEYTRTQAQAKKAWDEQKTDALREFSIQVADKTTTPDGIRVFGRQWKLTAGEMEHLEKRFSAPAEEPPSNPAVVQDLTIQVNRANPTIGEAGLRAKYDPKGGTGLNTKDFDTFINKLVGRLDIIKNRAQTLDMARYNQGEQEIFLALGIVPSQIDSLTGETKRLISLAINEYSARAFPHPDKKYEDSTAVKNEIIPRFQSALRSATLADAEEIRRTMAFPVREVEPDTKGIRSGGQPRLILQATSTAIEQAYAAGTMSKERYDVEKDKWRRLREALDRANVIPTEGATGAAPKVKPPAYTGTKATD